MFADIYKENGVFLGDRFGVPYPEAFGHPLAEYRALTTTAGLIDLCHWGVLRIAGSDRVRFLHSLVTHGIASLEIGEASHCALTTVKGKLVAELLVLRRGDELLVLMSQGDVHAVADAIDTHIVADDVIVDDASGRFAVLSVEGPKAREVVRRVFPGEPIPSERLRFIDADYQGTPVAILNNQVTGEKGLQVIVAAEGARRMRDYLIQSGRAEDMALVGRAAWNMRRVEAGLPWFGADVSDNFPAECRLEHLVSFEKGCFLGQEPLARMHHRGHPNWLLVGLAPAGGSFPVRTPAFFSVESAHTLPSDREQAERALRALDLSAVVPANAPLRAAGNGGKPSGRVTSAVFSPKLQSPLLMGYVRTGLAEAGQELLLSLGEADIVLTVTPLPVQ